VGTVSSAAATGQDISLSFHGLDLFKKQIKSIEFATDLSLQVVWQRTTITGPKCPSGTP
jgi:hypothetical protein